MRSTFHRTLSHIVMGVCLVLATAGCTKINDGAAPTSSQPTAADPPPNAPTATDGAAQYPVELSAGTALPMTLPDGTGMGFSVDYKVEQPPAGDGKAVWVIERRQGEAFRQDKPLQHMGTLQVVLPGWRPTDGPFQTHIEWAAADGSTRPLSAKEPLR